MSAHVRPAILAAAIGLTTMVAGGLLPPTGTAVRADDAIQQAAGDADLVSIRAHVLALDLQRRHVTVRGPDGRIVSVRAGDDITNLDQVTKGDIVDLRYHEAVALTLTKPGSLEPAAGPAEGATDPAAGTPPAGGGDRRLTITAQVVGVNLATHTLSLKGPRGRARTFEVRDPERQKELETVRLGDSLIVVYAEAAAVAIAPAPKS